ALASTTSASLRKVAIRCSVSVDHQLSVQACRALLTALSTSSALASANTPSVWPLAGLMSANSSSFPVPGCPEMNSTEFESTISLRNEVIIIRSPLLLVELLRVLRLLPQSLQEVVHVLAPVLPVLGLSFSSARK